jgi:stalled ribosome alternative rescue factor ArfA
MEVKMNRTAIVDNPIAALVAQRLLRQRRLARVQHRISLLSELPR